ncbi:MAG TPA: hypothetical protein VIT20_06865 [Propionibacteriaceae bacterium]
MRMRTLAGAAAALALAIVPLTTVSASAATLEVDYGKPSDGSLYFCDAKVGNTYVLSCFSDDGDSIYTADWEADGKRVATQWKLSDGSRTGLCISTKGPSYLPTQGWVGTRMQCDKNMVEGKKILIRGGTCDGDVSSCTKPSQYGQWTAWDSAEV